MLAPDPASRLTVAGITLEAITCGSGRPLLFLHPADGLEGDAPVVAALARGARVIAPSHPGFGRSALPPGMTSVDDLSYFYLDLLDELALERTIVVGVGLGGWIAAAMAVKSTARMGHLVLANPVGIKVSDRETRDIVDVFALLDEEFAALAYHDPALGRRDYAVLPREAALIAARNREAAARFGWSPYMHDPKLKDRLHRIRIPTLFLWGAHDRILSEPYGRAFCAHIPGARFEILNAAGHLPHVEQPEAFAARTLAFAESAAQSPRAALLHAPEAVR